ncbi:PLDc N-terminal domain-containing protein [Aeromicrobium wangtongii]|uniref:PLDc N-terminal domain-containing protein n=1 Tax=Aeromicrobium wangtongii TaxID=2969247 RepID=A0ABY5MEF5_9ACTN|nr:PLDc N-terminal domain-containing protein [Aeromicrobium wangtongii]MCD9197818.1 PLDc N-terminal domain-containing protein [Aeromicrobium wangtongii]MCL3819515.1 PLDc N-terminal domain-containing protein [Aeromicrobium wangtongii]UUP15299.1 PLDc N-terminal domain-containing protein [Aeromicrobium wangtongii]
MSSMKKKRWSDLTPGQRRAVYVAGALEAAATAAAWRDLAKRPAEDVRGPKLVWRLVSFVQPVGPLAYFTLGRR